MAGAGRLWSGPTSVQGAGLTSDEVNNIDIYRSSRDATVYITSTVYRRSFWDVYPVKDLGSGFILDESGRILTNHHVISGSNQVEVTLPDQTKYPAQVLVRDRADDLALIQIHPKKKLPFLKLGDSDKLQVGQKVLAIGNPFGLELTLTTGVVSSLGRTIQGGQNEQPLEGMIQTDAAINSGNSGGPLLDSQGSVIGINTAIYGPNGGNIGIGFAMPINRAKAMLDDYQSGKSFRRARLGVTVVYIAGDLAQALDLPREGGLLVQEVGNGSAAASAGIRGARELVIIGNAQVGVGGDLIVSVDGKPVDRQDAISRALAKKRAGDTLELTVYRAGRKMTVKVRLGEAPDDPA
ncbi:MAG: trypsin-like peptidase domain-containing protein [Acidobacteria bacterium]|nr:trypsin-like peptidase domain-containing protein [Acidobacteriota bacterium]